MHINDIKKLLHLKDKDIIITNFNYESSNAILNIEFKKANQTCPNCRNTTSYVHDYRTRKFKHGNVNGYNLIVLYKRRRYVCINCSKRFPEQNEFIDRYAKISNQLNNMILNKLRDKNTFLQISKSLNVSSSTVIRRFDKHYSAIKPDIPSVISIDEFKKSNTNSKLGKYALIISDPINKKVIDILPNRRKDHFDKYLYTLPTSALNNVKIAVIDMWEPYRDLLKKHFMNAEIVIDRFHYIRHIIWWLNDIRVKAMDEYKRNHGGYKLLKRYNKLLTKNPINISHFFKHNNYFKKLMSQKTIIDKCLEYSEDLKRAYEFYKHFQINTETPFENKEEALEFIDDYVNKLYGSKLDGSKDLANTFINWRNEIANSLYLAYKKEEKVYRYTNGFMEGVNNFIKTFRRMCFNIRDFNRFVTRIITVFNNEFLIRA